MYCRSITGVKLSPVLNLKDKFGNFTGVSLTITERFNGRNADVEKTSTTDFNMPESVYSASYFGNPKVDF